jgi:hypothetical protein
LPEYRVELSIHEDTVFASRTATDLVITFHVLLRNQDSRPLYYDGNGCGHALQRREAPGWHAVWTPQCTAAHYSTYLGPGESRLFTFDVRAPLTSTGWPIDGAEGDYRMVLWLTAVPQNSGGFGLQPLASASRTTPVFQIRETGAQN